MKNSETTTSHRPSRASVHDLVAKRSFATLATTSPAGRPHVAGVLYKLIDDTLFINTLRTSRKAKNIAANPNVGLCVIVRRLPVGPPSTIHFQSVATILELDDPAVTREVTSGRLKSLTSHGELELDDGCFLTIQLPQRVPTYGLGMSLRQLISDPLSAGGLMSAR